MRDYYSLENYRKRLQRSGYKKIHIVDLGDEGIFVSCFDLNDKFHHFTLTRDLLPSALIIDDLEA